MIKDLINISSDFQTSINIGFDLYNEDKIRNFIPTSAFLDIFSSIFKSTYITSNDRAKILSGAYGRGKSHIILVTLALICGLNKDKKTFSKILAYFRKQNIELYKQVESFLKNQRKFFPVVINGNSSSLSQAFLNGLETSLKLADLNDLIPETGFHTVLRTIDNWKNNYKATYNQLKNNVDNINDFLISLRNYEISSYKKFVELYPKLTSGSIFNAFNGADVVSLYENIANKIVEKGYEGIIVIYDEFSKYLESNIVNTEISDIKLLQDFAEKCNRSGKIQLHLILICHKDIENYIDSKLPKERIDGWRGVSGRFSHIDFQSDYNQTYEIISSVLDKTNKYEAFKENYKSIFNRIVEDYLNSGLFDNERILESVVYDCFPLQPDTTFVLPVLSEKIAQNERTLFTFLASDSHNSINDFLRTCKENFKLVTLDYVYDYFEPLLRKEAFNTEIYKLYNLSQKLINKFESKSSLEVKIIKSICLIYVIERFDKIKPLWESIIRIYKQSYDSDFIDSTLNRLIKEDCLVYQKRSNGFLKLKEKSGVNIQEEITNTLAKINERINIAETLNNINFDSFIYPNKYNEEHEMTRFFEFKFIESQEVKNNFDSISNSNCSDGYVFGIIPSNRYEIEELQKTVKKVSLNYKDSIFVVPNSYYEITQTVKEYEAIMLLREQYLEDTLLVNELDLYAEDLEEIISGYVYQYTHPESNSVTYFFNGNNEKINRKAQLSLLLSDICEKTYPNTPIINNEAINKNDLPGVAVNSRTKVVSGLLTNTLLPNLGLTGTGQDVSMMRSLLIRTGILLNHDTNPTINNNLDDAKLNKLLATIDDFFRASSSENVLNFSELYEVLVGKKYGFGIRKGIVPVYLAVIIRKYLNNLVIKFKGNEVRLTASLLNDINTNPDDYSAYIERIDNDKSKYLSELENIFSDYVVEAEKSLNSFRYIVLAMNRWYMSLPKYTKEMSKIYKGNKEFEPIQQEYIKFVKSLKQIPLNSRDYLFDELPKIFKGCKKIIALTNEIKNYVNTCNNSIGNLSAELCNDLIKIISKNNNSSELRNVIKDWFKTLKESTKSNLFPAFENSVLNVLSNVTNNDMETVQNLCKALTALQIEDWSEKTITDFLERFEEAITTINSFNRNDFIRSNNYNSYKISFIDDKGHETVKQLVKIQYTNRAKLLMNEIKTNIEEMGQSITPQEKRQVLFEILQELC